MATILKGAPAGVAVLGEEVTISIKGTDSNSKFTRAQEVGEAESFTLNVDDDVKSRKPLGYAMNAHKLSVNEITGEIRRSRIDSNMLLAYLERQGLSSNARQGNPITEGVNPKFDIIKTTYFSDGTVEVITLGDAILHGLSIDVSDASEHVTESISYTAETLQIDILNG